MKMKLHRIGLLLTAIAIQGNSGTLTAQESTTMSIQAPFEAFVEIPTSMGSDWAFLQGKILIVAPSKLEGSPARIQAELDGVQGRSASTGQRYQVKGSAYLIGRPKDRFDVAFKIEPDDRSMCPSPSSIITLEVDLKLKYGVDTGKLEGVDVQSMSVRLH